MSDVTTIKESTFEEWLRANLEAETIRELAEHGADAGWPGLTYYSDTLRLYDHFEDEIWNLAYEMAQEMGESHPLALIASFGGAKDVGNDNQFKNLMVWFIAEDTARRLNDDEG